MFNQQQIKVNKEEIPTTYMYTNKNTKCNTLLQCFAQNYLFI